MLENFAWDIFTKTGSIDGYLLYKQTVNLKENSGEYGTFKDDRSGNQTDQGQRQ
ncbi:MAG: YqzL family protein [Ruminococcaceae bacterium]|nr:YqzL family protein [Oscillospiraceae bacterium]